MHELRFYPDMTLFDGRPCTAVNQERRMPVIGEAAEFVLIDCGITVKGIVEGSRYNYLDRCFTAFVKVLSSHD